MPSDRVSPSTSSTQTARGLATNRSSDQHFPSQPPVAQSLEDHRSSSSSLDSVVTAIHDSLSFPSSSTPDIQGSIMFSTIIGHTRGLFPQRESKEGGVAGIGDFDHTPPHSGRSSADIPRKERDAASQQLLDKSSLVDLTNAIKDYTTAPMSVPLWIVSSMAPTEAPDPLPSTPSHRTSISQNRNVADSTCTDSRNETQVQSASNQTPLGPSTINPEED